MKLGDFDAIVCNRGARVARCQTACCRAKSTILCDYRVARGKRISTCDRRSCRRHAKPAGLDRDFCDRHAHLPDPSGLPEPDEQLGLFGEAS